MALSTSITGINAANADLNVTSHNIANVNTTGFKHSRAEFADIFQRTGNSKTAIGSGVRVSQVAQMFRGGPVSQTGRNMDLAIIGQGFFTLNLNGNRVFSRAGSFNPGPDGFVVNPQGARLQVFAPNASGGFNIGQLSDLQISGITSPPSATSNVTLGFTLPANAAVPTTTPFNPDDATSYNFSTGGVTVYDSLGMTHLQTSYFVKTANPNEWEMYSFIDGIPVDVAGGAPSMTLEFDTSGALLNPAPPQFALDPWPSGSADPLELSLNIADARQMGMEFALTGVGQDGYGVGRLNEIAIDDTGVVFARYSNNADVALGQVALANFANPQGLNQEGNTMWSQSGESGEARIGQPTTADFGTIQSESLEGSTVDLTEQLVNMIVAQRNFQANAQMLSTQDQTSQSILNIR